MEEAFTPSDIRIGTKIPRSTLGIRLQHLSELGYIDIIMDASGNRPAAYELTDIGLEEQIVDIKIIDAGDAEKRLYETLSDPKSERELLSVCTRFLHREKKEDREAEEASETLGHTDNTSQPDSKKQRVLGEG